MIFQVTIQSIFKGALPVVATTGYQNIAQGESLLMRALTNYDNCRRISFS